MSDTAASNRNVQDLCELSNLTPFDEDELDNHRFARGNMLGGSNPLEAANAAPWECTEKGGEE